MPETKESNPAASASPASDGALPLDRMIVNLEGFYQTLTGAPMPAGEESSKRPLPIERDPLEYVGEQVERLLRALELPVSTGDGTFPPPLAVWEGESELVLALDLPGVDRSEIEVTVEGQSVVVRGRRPLRREGLRLELCERPLGSFERRIVLPQRVDIERIEAALADGVLELRIAKRGGGVPERRALRVA